MMTEAKKTGQKEEETKVETDILADYWAEFMYHIVAAKAAWEKINESRQELPTENSTQLPVFARRCLSVYRRQKFEKMLPDFIRYTITAGGLSNNS
jgi:hypothetical protein